MDEQQKDHQGSSSSVPAAASTAMTIEAMARVCGLSFSKDDPDFDGVPSFLPHLNKFAKFAALVRSQAMEECAAICDIETQYWSSTVGNVSVAWRECAGECASAIRAAKEQG